MKRWSRFLCAFLVVAMILPGVLVLADGQEALDSNKSAERVFGKNRVETAIEVSNRAYKDEVDTLFLAGYNGDADALTATFMAGEMDAPLLLADKNEISLELIREVTRLNPKEIIILGGENAVSQNIVNELNAEDYNTRRIKGNSRIETAVNVAEDYYGDKEVEEVFVVEYDSLVDALAIGPVAAKTGIPVLITREDTVPEEVANFLKNQDVKKVTIVGGEGTVSEDGMEELGSHVDEIGRVSGKDRIETSLNIAKKYFKEPESIFIANGWKNADALIGGYFAGMKNSPVLLTNENKFRDDVSNYVKESKGYTYILGGQSVLSKYIFNKIEWLLGDMTFPEPKPEVVESKNENIVELRNDAIVKLDKRPDILELDYYGKDVKTFDDVDIFIRELIRTGSYHSGNIDTFVIYNPVKKEGGLYKIKIELTYMTSNNEEEFIDKEVSRVVRQIIKPNMDEFDKVKAIYDYIVDHKEYTSDGISAYTAYGFFKERKGVCNSFALAANRLLDEVGIDNYYANGDGKGIYDEDWNLHAWNMVKVDNKWYNIDTTYAFPEETWGKHNAYYYFMVSDSRFGNTHKPRAPKYLPKAIDKTYDGMYDGEYNEIY